MALTSGTRLGPYEIAAQIGVGGMGEVYRATDTKLKRDVAVKVLPAEVGSDAERLARFQREAEVLASLNHPNIAQIHGLEESGGIRALVMELVEGPTLADRIAQGAIPVDEALPIAKQIVEALEAAHEQGIIHRDLKPANVKVCPDGTVKVLDFGLAKAMEPTGVMSASASMSPTITTPAMTQAGLILGTAAYMSPEQARGRPVDRRADIWAFGCVLYEMLTGRRAFGGEDVTDTLALVVRGEPEWHVLPGTVRPAVTQLLRLCLQKDRRQRVGDAQSLRLALAGAFEVVTPPPASAPMRRRALAAAGFVVLGGLLGGIGVWTFRADRAPGEPTRVSLVLPAEGAVSFGGTPRSTLAMSPDGRLVAYTATPLDRARTTEIRVRSLDSLDTRVLPGTEGATQPFFSPDGRWVAFFTGDRELKKVALTGGAPITLFDELNGSTFAFGTWTDEDQIVFGANVGGLQRISAEGGTPEPLTTPDESGGELPHRRPTFIPGSRVVLFGVNFRDGTSRIEAVNLDSGDRRVVLDNAYGPHYIASGYLLFQRDEAVLVAPFDADQLVLTGPARPLGDAIRRDGAGNDGLVAQLALSPDGTLAFVPDVDALQRPVLVSRSGEVEPLALPPDRYDRVAVSPDGRSVAFEVSRGAENEVRVYDVARGTIRNLTQQGSDTSPSWRPDGLAVAVTTAGQVERPGLYVKELAGAERLLVPSEIGGAFPRNTSWSPDGRQLAYTVQTGSAHDIWVLNLDDGLEGEVLLGGPASEYGPRFSPDGRLLAYTSDESGRAEVYVKPYPQGASIPVSGGGGNGAVWSRDGGELFYQSLVDGTPTIMAVTVAMEGNSIRLGEATPLFVMGTTDADGTPQEFSGSSNGGSRWDVMPDGRFVMLQRPSTLANRQIVVVQNFFTELDRLVSTR